MHKIRYSKFIPDIRSLLEAGSITVTFDDFKEAVLMDKVQSPPKPHKDKSFIRKKTKGIIPESTRIKNRKKRKK